MSQTQMFAPRRSFSRLDHFGESARDDLRVSIREQPRHPATRLANRRETDIPEVRCRTADAVLAEFTASSLHRDIDAVLQSRNGASLELNST